MPRCGPPTDHELYRLFDRSPIGMYRSTEQGRFVYANPALARLLGYASAEGLLGVNLITDVYAGSRRARRACSRSTAPRA